MYLLKQQHKQHLVLGRNWNIPFNSANSIRCCCYLYSTYNGREIGYGEDVHFS